MTALNPVPRQFRRHLDIATAAEYHHASYHTTDFRYDPDKVDPTCWFCTHHPAEHIDHDVLVAECPECGRDTATDPALLAAYQRQVSV